MQGKSTAKHGIFQTDMLATLLSYAFHRLAGTVVLGW
jgi:hypothetical protein